MSYIHITKLKPHPLYPGQVLTLISHSSVPSVIHTETSIYEVDESCSPIVIQHTYSRMVKEALAISWLEFRAEHTEDFLIAQQPFETAWETVKLLKGHPREWPIREPLYHQYQALLRAELQKPHALQHSSLLEWFMDACILLGEPIDLYVKGTHLYQEVMLSNNENSIQQHTPLIVQTLNDYITQEPAFNEEKLSALFMLAEFKEDVYARLAEFWQNESSTHAQKVHTATMLINEWLSCEKDIDSAPVLLQQCLFYAKRVVPTELLDQVAPADFTDEAVKAWVIEAKAHFLIRYAKENPFMIGLQVALVGGFLLYGAGMVVVAMIGAGVIGTGLAMYKKFKKDPRRV